MLINVYLHSFNFFSSVYFRGAGMSRFYTSIVFLLSILSYFNDIFSTFKGLPLFINSISQIGGFIYLRINSLNYFKSMFLFTSINFFTGGSASLVTLWMFTVIMFYSFELSSPFNFDVPSKNLAKKSNAFTTCCSKSELICAWRIWSSLYGFLFMYLMMAWISSYENFCFI